MPWWITLSAVAGPQLAGNQEVMCCLPRTYFEVGFYTEIPLHVAETMSIRHSCSAFPIHFKGVHWQVVPDAERDTP